MKKLNFKLRCIECGKDYSIDNIMYYCKCGDILEVVHDLEAVKEEVSLKLFDKRLSNKGIFNSGVWCFKELIMPVDDKFIVSRPEGNTNLYCSKKIDDFVKVKNLYLKAEGENPTGSFKDRGMTTGITAAKIYNAKIVACASTGNTSASMASYASLASLKSVVFIPEGNIAFGKLAQALAFGAKSLQIRGNFDDAMFLVQEACEELKMYLLNSVNPFRIEGQKSIGFEILQQLKWKIPDWIVVPGGNLGNSSAIGKGLKEFYEIGLIDKIPKIAIIQAHGANPLYRSFKKKFKEFRPVHKPETVATAIKIGNPVSWKKAIKVIEFSKGVVEEVTEQEILDAKAIVDISGIGCEPASAASVAGTKKLVDKGVIDKKDKVVAILTGNLLKDPDLVVNYHLGKLKVKSKFANRPIKINADLKEVKKILK